MSCVIDITGTIQNGMWNYEAPFPPFHCRPLPKVPWVRGNVSCEIFEGMHSQTGTYLETPAHFFGNTGSYLLIDVPLEQLVDIGCVVLHVRLPAGGAARHPVTDGDLRACPNSGAIRPGDAVLVDCGWGKHWMDDCYLASSPYFTYDAMQWLIAQKPRILGSDFARWENLEKPEGVFPDFYAADILMLAPCVNLGQATEPRAKLSVLPLKIAGTSCAPCRAIIIQA